MDVDRVDARDAVVDPALYWILDLMLGERLIADEISSVESSVILMIAFSIINHSSE